MRIERLELLDQWVPEVHLAATGARTHRRGFPALRLSVSPIYQFSHERSLIQKSRLPAPMIVVLCESG